MTAFTGANPAAAAGPGGFARNLRDTPTVSFIAARTPTLAPFAHVKFCMTEPGRMQEEQRLVGHCHDLLPREPVEARQFQRQPLGARRQRLLGDRRRRRLAGLRRQRRLRGFRPDQAQAPDRHGLVAARPAHRGRPHRLRRRPCRARRQDQPRRPRARQPHPPPSAAGRTPTCAGSRSSPATIPASGTISEMHPAHTAFASEAKTVLASRTMETCE